MADQRVGPRRDDELVRVCAYVAREGGAQKPPAVSAEGAPRHNGGDADAEDGGGERSG